MKNVVLGITLFIGSVLATTAQTGKETISIKVLTLNILHGATTQNTFDLDAIAKVIADANPDFVALQEVDYKTNRAHHYDLSTELGWRTKLIPLFGRAMYFDGGEYGVGLLTKHSIIASKNTPLPFKEGNEPRTALCITTVLPTSDTLSFIATHLSHEADAISRQQQADHLLAMSKALKYPAILAGDLNDVPGSEPIASLEQLWTPSYNPAHPAPTYPSDAPRIKIDYIMSQPADRWTLVKSEVIADTIVSDHCAYLVTLELKRKAPKLEEDFTE
ncbi:endonuclease/exonuclease/phosphatase family protein [Carboxylicivirga taeanensis]|uniref:endonuclease/exonuclease/phosphatase family protein n=1 Tax=Carboxylicivirga taeanensis TaxID=1416875 RepID=UPI003F6DF61F